MQIFIVFAILLFDGIVFFFLVGRNYSGYDCAIAVVSSASFEACGLRFSHRKLVGSYQNNKRRPNANAYRFWNEARLDDGNRTIG